MQKKLTRSFYTRENVVDISRELLGKFLVTKIKGKVTSGMITETEAYNGIEDRASHAFNGRRTQRTEIMYCDGGTAYVYLCYGIHHLFNIVTNKKDVPHAVLIRAVQPAEGAELMAKRRKKRESDYSLTAGPGSLSQALGITTRYTGLSLLDDIIWVEHRGVVISENDIVSSRRIGVDYAGEHALFPWRFTIRDNPWVSK
jgi:DNA-3-methyladenine glycosylase